MNRHPMAWQAPTKGYDLVDGKLVRAPHPLENPDITDAEIEQLLGTMLEVTFQQEILAEFTEHEGQVFRFIKDNLWKGDGIELHATSTACAWASIGG